MIKGFSILISLMLVPMTLGYLSAELYGIWLTLSSIIVWLNFFDIGFTLGLKNKLAEAIAQEDWKRAKALVSTTYTAMLVIFLPLGVALEFLVPYINWSSFINVDAAYNTQLIQVVSVLVICFCLQMIFNTITAVLAAFQKVALSSLFPVIGNFIACLVIYVLTKTTEGSLINLAISISFLPVIVLFLSSIILYRGILRNVAPNIRYIDTKLIHQIFDLGVKFFIIQIQVVILFQSTNILISNVATPTDVTTYNIAYKCLSIVSMGFALILSPLWPAFTDAFVKDDFHWMKQAYKKMLKFFVLCACMVGGIILLSQPIYQLWIGDSVEVPQLMTIMVGIYTIVYMWDSLQVILLNGTGKVKLQTYITLLGMIVHIPLSLFLGHHLGAIGVVGSMIIVNSIYAVTFTTQIQKIIKQKAKGIWYA